MAATARAVDLTNVKDGGVFRPKRKPEGDYLAKIVKADDHQPNDKTKPLGWVLTIQIDGDARSTYPYYLSPDPKQAWKIGGIMRAAGFNTRNAKIKFDPNKLVNKTIGVALADDEYEGRPKSVIDDVFPKEEVGPNADEGVIEDEDIDTDEDIPEDDEPEEEPEPEPAPKRRRKPAPAPEPEPEEYEDDEEPEPEPEPAPKRRRPAATPAPAAKAAPPRRRKPAPAPEPEDDDDLDDLDTDDLEG